MARFRGTVKGNREETSRLGTITSGIQVTCNGWNLGVTVTGMVDRETGEDKFRIEITGGSTNPYSNETMWITTKEGKLESILKV